MCSLQFSKIVSGIVVLITIFASLGHAQKVTVSPELLLRDDYSFALLGQVDDKIVLVRNKGYTQTLSIFNSGLGFIQEIPMDFEDRKVNIIGFVTSEHDFNCYYSFRDDSKEYIKSVKLSSSGEQYFQDTVFVRENVFLSEYYQFSGSDDDRYIAIHNVIDESTLQLILYDNQEMEQLYETKLIVQDVSMRRHLLGIEVTNSGKLAVLFEKNNNSYRKERHHYRMVTLDKSGEVVDIRINLPEKLTVSAALISNNKADNFNLVGLYGDKFDNISIGYFVYEDDSVHTIPFPDKMLDAISIGSKKKLEGIEDYGLHEVVLRNDGGYIFVMESNKEFYRSTSGPRGMRGGYRGGITDYYNEDILVMSINPSGKFNWNTILPKKQFSQDDEGIYSSFFVFQTPSLLRLVYNDEIKNNNTVSEYIINPAGVYERNSVLSTAYQKLKLRIRSSIQVSPTSYLLTSERNNRLNIVKIEY